MIKQPLQMHFLHNVFWFKWCLFPVVLLTIRWYRMMTSSNGNIFRVTGHLCGEFTGLRSIPRTKASDAELWCFLWSAPINKRLSKQPWGWWFETPSWSLWRHGNECKWLHEAELVTNHWITINDAVYWRICASPDLNGSGDHNKYSITWLRMEEKYAASIVFTK